VLSDEHTDTRMKKLILLVAGIMCSFTLHADVHKQGVLASDFQFPLSISGKKVGSVSLKAGSSVSVVIVQDDGVLISRGESDPVKVSKETLTPESIAVAPASPSQLPVTGVLNAHENISKTTIKSDVENTNQPTNNPRSEDKPGYRYDYLVGKWVPSSKYSWRSLMSRGGSDPVKVSKENLSSDSHSLIPSPKQSLQITEKSFFDASFWTNPPLQSWTTMRSTENEQVYSARTNIPFFGTDTQEIRIKTETINGDEYVKNIEVVVIEIGNYMAATNSGGQSTISKIQQDANQLKARWPSVFNEKRSLLVSNMERFFGGSRSDAVGSLASVQKRIQVFERGDFTVQLMINNYALIEATIVKKGLSVAGISEPKSGYNRKLSSVKVDQNGDKFIEVPMLDQGPRGYCGYGTLAMLARYYGMDINIDELAAKPDLWNEQSKSVALTCHLQKTETPSSVPLSVVTQCIDHGQPIIVSRWTLPNKQGGHSSLITGYNKTTGEVLLTESWGENARNHRMKLEELQKNMWAYFTFTPF